MPQVSHLSPPSPCLVDLKKSCAEPLEPGEIMPDGTELQCQMVIAMMEPGSSNL